MCVSSSVSPSSSLESSVRRNELYLDVVCVSKFVKYEDMVGSWQDDMRVSSLAMSILRFASWPGLAQLPAFPRLVEVPDILGLALLPWANTGCEAPYVDWNGLCRGNGQNQLFVMGTKKKNHLIPLSALLYWTAEVYDDAEEPQIGFRTKK